MVAKVSWLLAVALLAVERSQGTSGTGLTWSLFTAPSRYLSNSTVQLQEYARQKLSTLRHLRNKLTDHHPGSNVQFIPSSNTSPTTSSTEPTTPKPVSRTSNATTSLTTIPVSKREEAFGSIFKNVDNLLSFTTGPLRKMVTSKKGIETLASMMMPKRDVLRKLLEIKGHLEPSLKRYLTDKYNGFLSSLIPYSENIGVPPFVLNSMKIPQDFDPRWQFIESLLSSQGGIEKFLHNVVNGDFKVGKKPEVIESRSGDETELISDQEPDASGQGYRKQPQFYLSSFKKRLMKPAGGKVRLVQQQQQQQQQSALRPGSVMDYEGLLDQSGQYGHVSYDMRLPDEMVAESMYSAGDNAGTGMLADMDLAMSATGHGGRGHGGGGHGHGWGNGHASYGGFLDPFTILGGLAFLTYLGLMLQNSLNRNGNGTAMGGAAGGGTRVGGRSFYMDTFIPVVPVNLTSPRIPIAHQRRHGRSLNLLQSSGKVPNSVTLNQVLSDIETLWKEIEMPSPPVSAKDKETGNCARFKQCKIVWKMRIMNLEPVFASKLFSSTNDLAFLNYVMTSGLRNLCEPFRPPSCK